LITQEIIMTIQAPSTPTLAPNSDSGTVGDGLTNVTTPMLTGTGIVGDTVFVDDDTSPITQLEAFDSSTWVPFGTAPTVTTSTDPDPNGASSTVDQVTLTTDLSGLLHQTSVAGAYTFSVWVRLVSGDGNLALNYYSNSTGQPQIEEVVATGTWQQVSLTFIGDGNAASNVALMHDALQSTSGTFEFWNPQLIPAIGSAVVDSNGNWSVMPTAPLADGAHSLTVTQTDPATFIPSASSGALVLTIDTSVPAVTSALTLAPASDSGAVGDGLTNVASPEFTGTGTVGDTISLYDGTNTTAVGSAVVDANGNWSVTPATSLADGMHSLTVIQTDAAGTSSAASSAFVLTIDTSVPAVTSAPSLAPASDSGTPGDGITSVASPEFTGTGTAGDTVSLYDGTGTTAVGSAVVDTTGNWSVTPTAPLADGVHSLTVTQTDAAGTSSAVSGAFVLTIDTSVPVVTSAPTLAPASDSGAAGDGLTNVATPVLTGTGTTGDTISVYDGTGTTAVGSAVVDVNGNWSVTPTAPLADGSHSLTTTQTDAAGTSSARSAALALTIDTVLPTISGTVAGQAMTDTATLAPFATVGIADPNVLQSVTVTLSSVANGTLTNLGSGSYDATAGLYTVTGSAGDVTSAINGLVFTPTQNGASGQIVTTGFTITDTDSAGSSVTDTTTSVIATSPIVPPAAVTNFMIADTTTGGVSSSAGTAYTGPVAGLQNEFITTTSDNLAITATAPNSFIHSGSGEDAIDVSHANGNNVLDGSTGSNFLVGGTGSDTFFVDDRGPSSDIWSTVSNFHSGDAATLWGITPGDFSLSWVDGQGAAGFTGLTLHATAPGAPTASLTLAGFSSADLSDGKLTVSFGMTSATGGVPGSSYMYVHAN
jgi:hypothetical protein